MFYHNVDTVGAGEDFKARLDVLAVEETVAVVRVLEEKWGGWIDFTDFLLLKNQQRPLVGESCYDIAYRAFGMLFFVHNYLFV